MTMRRQTLVILLIMTLGLGIGGGGLGVWVYDRAGATDGIDRRALLGRLNQLGYDVGQSADGWLLVKNPWRESRAHRQMTIGLVTLDCHGERCRAFVFTVRLGPKDNNVLGQAVRPLDLAVLNDLNLANPSVKLAREPDGTVVATLNMSVLGMNDDALVAALGTFANLSFELAERVVFQAGP